MLNDIFELMVAMMRYHLEMVLYAIPLLILLLSLKLAVDNRGLLLCTIAASLICLAGAFTRLAMWATNMAIRLAQYEQAEAQFPFFPRNNG